MFPHSQRPPNSPWLLNCSVNHSLDFLFSTPFFLLNDFAGSCKPKGQKKGQSSLCFASKLSCVLMSRRHCKSPCQSNTTAAQPSRGQEVQMNIKIIFFFNSSVPARIQNNLVIFTIKMKLHNDEELNTVNILSFQVFCVEKSIGLLEAGWVWICRQFKIRWEGSRCFGFFLYIPAFGISTS